MVLESSAVLEQPVLRRSGRDHQEARIRAWIQMLGFNPTSRSWFDSVSVDDLASVFLFQFEMRNLEGSQRVERQAQRFIARARPAPLPQVLSYLSQGPQHPRPVKPLALTVFAEICHRMFASTLRPT